MVYQGRYVKLQHTISLTTKSPTDAAFRIKDPAPLVPDDSMYVPLRPGVMVSSTDSLSTAGVLVKNSRSESFIRTNEKTTRNAKWEKHSNILLRSAHSHDFPEGDTDVHHPDPNALIGKVVRRIGSTDVALVKLHDHIRFENHTFQTLHEPDGVVLCGISDPKCRIGGIFGVVSEIVCCNLTYRPW
jgi:hypothetical protein